MPITSLYAGLLTLFFVGLSLRVIAVRHEARIGLGDGGNRLLLRRQRAHANFAEYVPLALILMILAEAQHAPAWMLHIAGVTLVTGRAAHAWGVSQEPEPAGSRQLGMGLTFVVLILAALGNVGLFLTGQVL